MTKILFHGNCADGIFAAYFAESQLNATCHAVRYQEPLPNLDGEDVICVDYSLPLETLKTIRPKSLLIIDHHVSAHDEIGDFKPDYPFEYVYDVTKCGAVLTFEHFYPHAPLPWILPYIQDRDLWKWELPDSKAIDACIQSYPFTFENCSMLEIVGRKKCAYIGESILRYQDKLIRQAVGQAREIEFEGYKVMSVNSSVLQSEIGAELCRGRPFAIIWFNRDNMKRFVYSLRSENVDVSKIAQKYGGGGHKYSASFSLPWHMEYRDAQQTLTMISEWVAEKKCHSVTFYPNGTCSIRGVEDRVHCSLDKLAEMMAK